MKEQQHNAKEILHRYINGECTEEERAWVEEWYQENYDSTFKIDSTLAEEHLVDVWEELEGEMKRKRVRHIQKIAAIAASVAIVFGLGIFYINKSEILRTEQDIVSQQDSKIQAGRNQALLTLADGRTIHLDSVTVGDYITDNGITAAKTDGGTLAYATGEVSKHLTKEVYNTISTPRGGQYKVVLPDNSIVWLNAASSLRFPVAFTADKREVELIGEGYFDIAHDPQKPFIVSSAGQQTIVKGTKFNISSYPDDPAKVTTLLKGSVLVKNTHRIDSHEVLLLPNEQAILQDNAIQKSKVEAKEVIAWKDGKFKFNNTPLRTIMQQLARWYDIEIVYTTSTKGVTFTGSVSRFDDIQDVLRKISLTESVQFETKGRRVMVRP